MGLIEYIYSITVIRSVGIQVIQSKYRHTQGEARAVQRADAQYVHSGKGAEQLGCAVPGRVASGDGWWWSWVLIYY